MFELEEDEVLDEGDPLAELATEGAVGASLLENWHPVSSTDAAIITVRAQMFLIMSRYTSVSAHTILPCAINSKSKKV